MILQKIRNKLGFTLIELMIVIVIIALAIAGLIPIIAGIDDGLTDGDEIEIIDQSQEDEPEVKPPEKETEKL
jgi:prepilin-type N-terminal cleavage/methylation domain-containing protein